MKNPLDKMKKNKILLLIIIFLSFYKTNAQEILSIEDAVKIALENNFEIRISKNLAQVNQTNIAYGNAGMLPKVTANVTDNNSIQNTSQIRQDGTVNNLNNAKNNNLTYGVGLDWTIFDGFKMFAKLDQLKELKKLGEAQLKFTIITKVREVNSTYYNLVQQKQQLAALDTSIVISKQRLEVAKNRYTIGKASKLEVLNAQVDLNTDTTELLRQKESYANTKTLLNQILARELTTDFEVNSQIIVDKTLQLTELEELAKKQNPVLLSQLINKKISELQLKQVQADRYPLVRVNSAYNFSESESSLGFIKQASSKGLNYGFIASLNLFDGFAQNRNEKIAKIQIENSTIAIAQQTQSIEASIVTFFQTYQTNLELSKVEEKNEEIAKQNLEITLEKFKIGTITTIEFRTAQLNYITAKVRNSNANFLAKLSEISLKELSGHTSF